MHAAADLDELEHVDHLLDHLHEDVTVLDLFLKFIASVILFHRDC